MDKKVIKEAGAKILLSKASLDDARIKSFHRKVSGTIALKCSKLPPTSVAFQQHSLRVYVQVQEWMVNHLDSNDWDWYQDSNGE